MKLLIIRHGESEADVLNVHEGRADFALTQRGHRQAAAMAAWVAQNHRPDFIYVSPLLRARQTADHLSAAAGISAKTLEDLQEFNNGLLAGMAREEAARRYPLIPDLPMHKTLYGQESRLDFRMRAERVLSAILNENPLDATIAVISHGGLINQLYHAFLRLPIANDIIFPTGDAGVHIWKAESQRRVVVAANLTAHTDTI